MDANLFWKEWSWATHPAWSHESPEQDDESQVAAREASDESRAILGDERFERHGRTAADLLDVVVRAREDPVLVIDRDLAKMLEEEGIPCRSLRRPLEIAGRCPRRTAGR